MFQGLVLNICHSQVRLYHGNKNTVDWQLINNRQIFLTVLEAGKSKIKAPADLVSGKALFPGSQMTLLTVLT